MDGRRLFQWGVAVLCGAIVGFTLFTVARAASTISRISAGQATAPGDQSNSGDDPVFLKTYAHVNTQDAKVPVFASPEEALIKAPPIRELGGYEWLTVISSTVVSNTQFTAINPDGWVYSDQLTLFRPSRFQGRTYVQTPDHPIAWVLSAFEPVLEPDGDTSPDAPTYQRYDVVTIYEKQLVGSTIWYRIGDKQWSRQQRLAIMTPREAPATIRPSDRLHGKWISVNLFEQTLAAYEGETLVYASLVSSGLPQWETVKGLFQIQIKNKLQPMYNAAEDPSLGDYHLDDVPYNMFFFQDYALHGTYWHDGFGYRHSRGCVNLSIYDAKWLYNWTTPTPGLYAYTQATPDNPGTWVWVY